MFCGLNASNTTRIRSTLAIARCVESRVSLLVTYFSPDHHAIVHALDYLLYVEQLVEIIVTHGTIVLLFGLMCGGNYPLHEVVINALTKLSKD